MKHGDIRALEDEQDPARRKALIERLAQELTPEDVKALLAAMPELDMISPLLGLWESAEPASEHTCDRAPGGHTDYETYTLVTVDSETLTRDGYIDFEYGTCPYCHATVRMD